MSRLAKGCAVAALFAIAAPAASAKDNSTLCYKAHGLRAAVVQKHGKRAPGRNICRYGLKSGQKATTKQKARYVRNLKKLNVRYEYLAVNASFPGVPPAGTLTPKYAPTGLASCIVRSESGGNPTARNGQYSGIAQWSPEAWARHGGLKYASSPTGATYQQQLKVLNDGLAKFGCSDWCPFDPC
jgi:hypothetical protein